MPAENVTITGDIATALSGFLNQGHFTSLGVLVDENTAVHCYPLIRSVLPLQHTVIEIQSGEMHKNLDTCIYLWSRLTEAHFDRKALLINLGGGVIGDMGGFCAATYKRGIPFINLPTTLLAQVDASVGGKLGIDFQGFKNHIGLFQEPQRVFIDPVFLQTLPERELRSGFAEVIKHALISDAAYWPKLRNAPFIHQDWSAHIDHSIQTKSRVVDEDFREGGLRKILNFGHTIGHAVESFFLETERPLLHGEAIAVGMLAETYLSIKYSRLSQEEAEEIEDFVLAVFGQAEIPSEALEKIVLLARQDKKNDQTAIRCTLLEKIGVAHYDVPIPEQAIKEALEYYQGLSVGD